MASSGSRSPTRSRPAAPPPSRASRRSPATGRAKPAPTRAAAKASSPKRGPTKRRRATPPSRSRVVLRWLAVGGVALAAFLYVRPLRTYLHTRATLDTRTAQVQRLRRERATLERRVAFSRSAAALQREARRLGFVKPGERLYIVQGIRTWRHAQHAATIRRGG